MSAALVEAIETHIEEFETRNLQRLMNDKDLSNRATHELLGRIRAARELKAGLKSKFGS
jgi:hypothetical protein